ncbi:hypothetical protein LRP52_28255 [Photobacterium sp. ZSDE20]|uniref:Uncharacterized protein n=1 Tax=Photobacterium pectinilyticum TaxID=2906793 RepID=A0ABT1N553_9GAMM|nr:hypothetical protein [Photobacterium sp. ZSDE20]MCQ1059883.1 hypothetical protein [Photobacterium sp. ZSDE20]MDD1826072.1 hypothetical protein [Photobacterium sp. ZSDE20]
MIKKVLLSALLCIVINSSYASDWNTEIVSWEEEYPLSTHSFKIKGEDLSIATAVGAEVIRSHQGTQRLYINFYIMNEADACNPSDTPRKATILVNNQPIQMSQFCHYKNEVSMLQTTALSDKGVNFIINAFRNSQDTVRIKYGSFDADLSAVGFTEAWGQGN